MTSETTITITVGRLAAKLAEAMADGMVMGRAAERREIAAWLRNGEDEELRERHRNELAVAIERGEHVR